MTADAATFAQRIQWTALFPPLIEIESIDFLVFVYQFDALKIIGWEEKKKK